MKNILFICDSFTGGGLETRIIEQVATLKKSGVRAFLLCRKFNNFYSDHFISASDALILEPSPQSSQIKPILIDIQTICDFCKKNKIDFIDCQPFWCALPATLAANKLNIPISFTLHGTISADFISSAYLPAQALYDTIFSYGFDQIFAVAEYLANLYSYLPHPEIIRNGTSIKELTTHHFKTTNKIAITSRLDEPKTKLIIDFLPSVYADKTIKEIDIYGDGDNFDKLKDFVRENNMSDKVHLCGWTKDFIKTIAEQNYMLVIGMGRVVLEAIKSGTPVGILGYGGFAGLVNHTNLLEFSKTNLTSWQKSSTGFSAELKHLLKNPQNYLFNSTQLTIFDNSLIWKQYHNTICKLSHTNKPIIDSLYKWLTKNPTADLFTDQNLLALCLEILSNNHHPISSRLLSGVIKNQSTIINELTTNQQELKKQNQTLTQKLQQEQSLPLSQIAKKRLRSRLKKH